MDSTSSAIKTADIGGNPLRRWNCRLSGLGIKSCGLLGSNGVAGDELVVATTQSRIIALRIVKIETVVV